MANEWVTYQTWCTIVPITQLPHSFLVNKLIKQTKPTVVNSCDNMLKLKNAFTKYVVEYMKISLTLLTFILVCWSNCCHETLSSTYATLPNHIQY